MIQLIAELIGAAIAGGAVVYVYKAQITAEVSKIEAAGKGAQAGAAPVAPVVPAAV